MQKVGGEKRLSSGLVGVGRAEVGHGQSQLGMVSFLPCPVLDTILAVNCHWNSALHFPSRGTELY